MNRRGFLRFLGLAPVAVPAAIAMPAGAFASGGFIRPLRQPLVLGEVPTETVIVKLKMGPIADDLYRMLPRDWFGIGRLRADHKCADCDPAPLALPVSVRGDEICEART